MRARFVDLPTEIPDAPCHQVLLAVVSGEGTFGGEKLGAGDTVVVMNPAATRVEGAGLAVLVDHPAPPERCVVKTLPATEKKILRGASAPPLTWGKGAMTARLDVTSDLSPHLYLGRLEGTAPVKEHDHPTSWEILCAVEAAGTFTLDGVEKRLGPRQIVAVPAGKKHAWQPDPGSKLVGIQLYVPPGPEQRFKALAAAETAPPPSR